MASPPSQNHTHSKKPARIWSFAKKSKVSSNSSEFRSRFLTALQFYCDTPSLILNSDLPADLVEYVTGQNQPVEALSVILQLKKGSHPGAGQNSTSTRNSELSRRLVESWMSADSCSEALGSLSLGDEVPGVIAETAALQRGLFALCDVFHIPPTEFVGFLLSQVVTTLEALVWGVREDGYQGRIRSQGLSTLLDRCFTRFYADEEQFYRQTGKKWEEPGPFFGFIQDLETLCKDDFIARRFVAKILLGLGASSANKLAKTGFLMGRGNDCPLNVLLYPAEDFYKSPVWSHTLRSSLPTRTGTKNKVFWSNWASFIVSSAPQAIGGVWEKAVANWACLCRSSAVNSHILLPATYALIGIGREIKSEASKDGAKSLLVSADKVFESLGKCLDSTDEDKKACGMALAQVVGDLQCFLKEGKNPDPVIPPPELGDTQVPESWGSDNKLKFSSTSPVFKELIEFYENGVGKEEQLQGSDSVVRRRNPKKFEVLDSDDEIEDEEDEAEREEKASWAFMTEDDLPVDERILDYRSKKGKLPQYFSEFMEILVESGGGTGGNEGELEVVKYFCIMRIPLLLSVGVRIDANMAVAFVKVLLDYEADTGIEVPIIFGLTELAGLYPLQVFETLATTAFDRDHYTSGHRMITLRRVAEVVMLLSKSKCFSCFSPQLQKSSKELVKIAPEFFKSYWTSKKKIRVCPGCAKKGEKASEVEIEDDSDGASEELTWREIVDLRVKGKARYFYTKKKTQLPPLPDEYSSKILPIVWASLANRVLSQAPVFLDEKEREVRGAPNDAILAQVFRLLGRILLGSSSTCPHLGAIATQVGELSRTFVTHPDASVRRAVYSLVAVLLTISNGAFYVVEAVGGGLNIFEVLKRLREAESHPENVNLLNHVIAFMAAAATSDYRLQFSSEAMEPSGGKDSVYSKLRFLPE